MVPCDAPSSVQLLDRLSLETETGRVHYSYTILDELFSGFIDTDVRIRLADLSVN